MRRRTCEFHSCYHFAVFICHIEIACVACLIPTICVNTNLVAIQAVAYHVYRLTCRQAVNRCRNRHFATLVRRYNAVFYRCDAFIRTAPNNETFIPVRYRFQGRRFIDFNHFFTSVCKNNVNRCIRRKLCIRNGENIVSFSPSSRLPCKEHIVNFCILCFNACTNAANLCIIIYHILQIKSNRIYTVSILCKTRQCFTKYVQIRYV